MTVQAALAIIGDTTGFWPDGLRKQAREVVNTQGTKEQKELAMRERPFGNRPQTGLSAHTELDNSITRLTS